MYFVLFWGLFPPLYASFLVCVPFFPHISLSAMPISDVFVFLPHKIPHYSLQTCEATFTPELGYTSYLTPSCVKTQTFIF